MAMPMPTPQKPPEKVLIAYEDYAALPDDGKRYEVLEGELYVCPSPTRRHQEALGNLFVILHRRPIL